MGRLLIVPFVCAVLLFPAFNLPVGAEEKASDTPTQAPAQTSESQKDIKQISLEELNDMLTYTYRDKVVLLSFWSPYCGECRDLLPLFSDLHDKYRDEGFEVIGISLVGYPEKVWLALNRVRVEFPVFMGNADVFDAYNIHTMPTVIFIGRDGNEDETAEGHEADAIAFDNEVQRLLEGRQKGGEWIQWLLR
ncbi:MAG: TlpA disulfide reductase family protein [Planctomycetota bacterium]|jgi:thiol-disulfide isomerase/thioredoxin